MVKRKATRYKTSQEWLEHSSQLIQAQPQTTRITTKYSTSKPRLAPLPENPTPDQLAKHAKQEKYTDRPPRAKLVLKTFDPVSGSCLKYRTTKAAEVGRLVLAMGKLGRGMASLPDLGDGGVEEVPAVAAAATAGLSREGVGGVGAKEGVGAGGKPGGGGGKKKKKGKK